MKYSFASDTQIFLDNTEFMIRKGDRYISKPFQEKKIIYFHFHFRNRIHTVNYIKLSKFIYFEINNVKNIIFYIGGGGPLVVVAPGQLPLLPMG